MVGTFYRAASPESGSFVDVGKTVNDDTVVCIIEAMKVMNEIKAEKPGKIVQILVENGEAVEYGQPLFLIKR
jgi:acetyl-CoA carboxylase biotin carboxyl carrier protein